jgi:lysophospholipase L1-like esterase
MPFLNQFAESSAWVLGLAVAAACSPAARPAEEPRSEPMASVVASGSRAPAALIDGSTNDDAAPDSAATDTVTAVADRAGQPALPKGTLVLHFGDSFAASLGIPLGKRFKERGLRSALEMKTASFIPDWAFGKEVLRYVAKYNPDLVLITLGGNELEVVNPEQRAGAVKKLISHLGGRPCVWIAPPLWKQDTGLLQVIRDNVAPCRYADTNALIKDLPRGPDKIHPTPQGRELWADAMLDWLARERLTNGARPWALKPEPERPR